MKVELVRYTSNPKQLIKDAVSITTMVEAHDKIIKRLIKAGAESPLEHVVFTFKVSEVSRALTHQLVRHRIASYTQESQRYVKYDGGFGYVIPPAIQQNQELLDLFKNHMAECSRVYGLLRAAGITPEDARFVLPNACHTTIYITMNVRSLRNFFKVRCHPSAQWEIRKLAYEMLKLCKEVLPDAFYDLNEK